MRRGASSSNKQLEQWQKSPEFLAGKLMFDVVLGKGGPHYQEIQQRAAVEFSNPEKYGHTPEDLKKLQEAYVALPSERAAYRAEEDFEKGCQL